jgi:hypothetical protein
MVVVAILGKEDRSHPRLVLYPRVGRCDLMTGRLTNYAVTSPKGRYGARRYVQKYFKVSLAMQYAENRYWSQSKVIGGGIIKSSSPTSIPLKDLFLTLLVWISRFVR